MNREQLWSAGCDMLYLAICAIKRVAPERGRIEAMDLQAVYSVAERHMITAAVAMAVESAGCGDAQSAEMIGRTLRRAVMIDGESAAVQRKLEEAGIWYMPLKGAVLKDIYPLKGMREMADQDILIDESSAGAVREIMEGLGYKHDERVIFNHEEYSKPPIYEFEMHRALFFHLFEQNLSRYYQNVKDRIVRDEGSAFRYRFTDDDFYIYMIAHAHKHFNGAGTGARFLMDICVYIKHFDGKLNWEYIRGELEKLGIAETERQSRELAMKLYNEEALTPENREVLRYILESGCFGTFDHMLSSSVMTLDGSARSKLRYIRDRIFPPMELTEICHPFFYRHRLLMPVLVLWRILKSVTVYRKRILPELFALLRYKGRQDAGAASPDDAPEARKK